MLGRTVSDTMLAAIYHSMIMLYDLDPNKQDLGLHCHIWGPVFAMFFLTNELYFASIFIDFYRTLTNPFIKTFSNSIGIHIFIYCVAICAVSIFSIESLFKFLDPRVYGGKNAWGFRSDFEICLVGCVDTINVYNALIEYIPIVCVNIISIYITIWSYQRLKLKVLDKTFELRWNILKKQFAITICYMIGYLISMVFIGTNAAISFLKTDGDDSVDDSNDSNDSNLNATKLTSSGDCVTSSKPTFQTYFFTAFVVVQCAADACAWYFSHRVVKNPNSKSKIQNFINNSRYDVIEFDINKRSGTGSHQASVPSHRSSNFLHSRPNKQRNSHRSKLKPGQMIGSPRSGRSGLMGSGRSGVMGSGRGSRSPNFNKSGNYGRYDGNYSDDSEFQSRNKKKKKSNKNKNKNKNKRNSEKFSKLLMSDDEAAIGRNNQSRTRVNRNDRSSNNNNNNMSDRLKSGNNIYNTLDEELQRGNDGIEDGITELPEFPMPGIEGAPMGESQFDSMHNEFIYGTHDLSDALRREVIAYMTNGISQCVKHAAFRSYKRSTMRSYDGFGLLQTSISHDVSKDFNINRGSLFSFGKNRLNSNAATSNNTNNTNNNNNNNFYNNSSIVNTRNRRAQSKSKSKSKSKNKKNRGNRGIRNGNKHSKGGSLNNIDCDPFIPSSNDLNQNILGANNDRELSSSEILHPNYVSNPAAEEDYFTPNNDENNNIDISNDNLNYGIEENDNDNHNDSHNSSNNKKGNKYSSPFASRKESDGGGGGTGGGNLNIIMNDNDDNVDHSKILNTSHTFSATIDDEFDSQVNIDNIQKSMKTLDNILETIHNNEARIDEMKHVLAIGEFEPNASNYARSLKIKDSKGIKVMNIFITNENIINSKNLSVIESVDTATITKAKTQNSKEKIPFTDYAPHVFRYLRTNIYNISDFDYLSSIEPCFDEKMAAKYLEQEYNASLNQNINHHNQNLAGKASSSDVKSKFTEGRSGAFFFYTIDQKYIIKTIPKEEAQTLLDILQDYVVYLQKNCQIYKNVGNRKHMGMGMGMAGMARLGMLSHQGGNNSPMNHEKVCESYLNRYFGLYSITFYGKTFYFIVIKNVFVPNHEPSEKYDIKGSWIDRHTKYHVDSGKLMKDEDLHKKLELSRKDSNAIWQQIYKDVTFLKEHNIMDYSLLLGIYYVSTKTKDIRKLLINGDNFLAMPHMEFDDYEWSSASSINGIERKCKLFVFFLCVGLFLFSFVLLFGCCIFYVLLNEMNNDKQ